MLSVVRKAVGVFEVKREGISLSGVEKKSDKYTKCLPNGLPYRSKPLPFSHQSTRVGTRFKNRLEPTPRSRSVFVSHRPEMVREWLDDAGLTKGGIGELLPPSYTTDSATLLTRLQTMPPLIEV
jgi:type I restriction enzyme R subunit